MTPTEIIYHRRVRVLEHAAKSSVAEASRVFGVSRTTIHRWRNLADSYGLDALIAAATDLVVAVEQAGQGLARQHPEAGGVCFHGRVIG